MRVENVGVGINKLSKSALILSIAAPKNPAVPIATQNNLATNIPAIKATGKNKLLNAGLILGGMTIAGAVIYGFFKKQNKIGEFKELKQAYSKLIEQYPNDEEYYKALAQGIGLKKGEEFRLSSILGQDRLTSLLKTFTKEDFEIGENFEGVKNLTYRVNLHNHTTVSDGKLSVKEILEQARKWADKIAQKTDLSDGKPAFTIAITDHDTLDGVREAVKIISDDPIKYKNLNVVLGSEISVSHIDSSDVQKPLNFEMIGYCLDPFNKHLNGLLSKISKGRKVALDKFIESINKEFPQYNLSSEETKFFHANLGQVRTNGVLYLAKDYAKFKILLSDYAKEINEKIIPEGMEKINAQELFEGLGDDYYFIMDTKGVKDMTQYFKEYGLKSVLEKRGILTPENSQKYYEIFNQDFSKQENFLKDLLDRSLPTLSDKKDYILTPDEVFAAARKDGTKGFFGFAHPGFIRPAENAYADSMKGYWDSLGYQGRWEYPVFKNLLTKLRQSNSDLFKSAEVNYQSYGKLNDIPEEQSDWLNFIKQLVEDNGMLKAGGVDCHKTSIFKKHKYLTKDEINLLNLRDIVEG